jgi:hypothetical protein
MKENINSKLVKTDNVMVNSPGHYLTSKGIECIDAIEAALENKKYTPFTGLCIGNAMKYLFRLELKAPDSVKKQTVKDKTIEDLEKACWYINKAIIHLKSCE